MSEKIIQLNEDGFREVLGAAEGMKEDKASWVSFFHWLRGGGLDGVKLIVGDKCLHLLGDGGLGEVVLLYRLRKAAQPHHGLKVFEGLSTCPPPFPDALPL